MLTVNCQVDNKIPVKFFSYKITRCKKKYTLKHFLKHLFSFSLQVVWRYLLNVYPDGLTGQERMDYMKRKTREYDQLKSEWASRVSLEDLEFIRGNVLKDVLRTDRAHPYYAGSEDSPHLTALTDLLTTFAITHPQVGMNISFLLKKILVCLFLKREASQKKVCMSL